MAKNKLDKIKFAITLIAVIAIALAALSFFKSKEGQKIPPRQDAEIR